jgi:xylulokinase
VVKGTWIYQGAISFSGASLNWFQQELCTDLVQEAEKQHCSPFAMMDQLAEQSIPGANGLVFLPYMLGERSPVWDPLARGIFFGLSLYTKRADMIRAILEACGYGMRQLMTIAEDVTGRSIREFVSMGGGSKSLVWPQIKANITGANVHILRTVEAAPLGAALLAGVGCGCFKNAAAAAGLVNKQVIQTLLSNDENREVYDSRYRVYTELYPRLKELYTV